MTMTVPYNLAWYLRANVEPGTSSVRKSVRTGHDSESQARQACGELAKAVKDAGGRILWACLWGPPYNDPIWIVPMEKRW